MDKRKAIEKIRKCLALSASANEHEAAAALRQARKLMEEYKVSDQDIDAIRADEAKARSGVTSQPARYETHLACVIADAFGCRSIFVAGWAARRAEWRFIGCGASPEIAQYAFTVLLRQLKRSRQEYIKTGLKRCKVATKTRRADLFCEGWVLAAVDHLAALVPAEDETRAMDAYIAIHYPSTSTLASRNRNTGKTLSDREVGDRQAGRRSGRDAQLNRGINEADSRLMLGGQP